MGRPPFVCSKVLNEGKWTGKYHYAWDKVFPALPPTILRSYRKLAHACLDGKVSARPACADILSALEGITDECLELKAMAAARSAAESPDAPRPVAPSPAGTRTRGGASASELYM